MTEDQQTQFNKYGCVSRSIIKATEIRNTPISPDDFITRYSHLFPKDQCGLLSIDGFCEVVKALGLAKRVNSTIDVPYIIECLQRGMKSHIFMMSERIPPEETPNGHCRLVLVQGTVPAQNHLKVEVLKCFCPRSDGSDNNDELVLCSALPQLVVHFFVLTQ